MDETKYLELCGKTDRYDTIGETIGSLDKLREGLDRIEKESVVHVEVRDVNEHRPIAGFILTAAIPADELRLVLVAYIIKRRAELVVERENL